ncbi:MAG: polysaccharide biosynthesis tyrosine autokinase, partial [Gemmatimonadales bacterium]
RYRYTDAHPAVTRVASEVAVLEQVTLPTLARTLVDQIATQESALEDQIRSASQDLRQIPPRAIEEARLRRDVAIAENLYTTLQARYEEARLAEASSIPDVRILDAAVPPESPIRNTARRILLMGLMAGLGLGLLGAVVLDRLDPRFRYPEQATRDLGLTILGAIPRVRTNNGAHAAAPVVEALRSLRLNLAHAHGAAGPMVVTITSPGAGEGKSFVSSNLALAFADSGQRTLLIDADLRRGILHRVLKAERKPGLADFLKGTASLEEIVKPTAQRSLHFIGGGSRMQEAPEMLSSGALVELLTRVRSHFSVIIVDSPPLAAGVDPFVLATRTGSMLLVLRTGVTDRELALTKLDNLDRLPIRVLGAVLNDVNPTGVYRYYGYLGGYETADEDGDESPRRPPRRIRSASGQA